jgi:hypothetical protein
LVRGLAPNGVNFAPGGTPSLQAWVTDPAPNVNESEHYCAWVTTPDGIGVTGLRVHFVLHVSGKQRSYDSGSTDSTGLSCLQRSLTGVRANQIVTVDAFAGALHAATTFTIHS